MIGFSDVDFRREFWDDGEELEETEGEVVGEGEEVEGKG